MPILTPFAKAPLPHRIGTVLALLLLSLCGGANAEQDQDLVTAVQEFLFAQTQHLGDAIHIEVAVPAAHFADCGAPEVFFPRSAAYTTANTLMGRVSVGVRCSGNKHSTRYITAHVGVTGTYVQLATGVAAGTLISADMLELRQGDLSSLPRHTILLADAAIGQISARQLNAGTVLRKQDLRTRPLVRRGQEVSIETRGPGFVVSRSGEAMQAGGLGDTVRVRLSRQETVTTVVSGEGRVRIR